MKYDPLSQKSVEEVLKLSLYSNQPLLRPSEGLSSADFIEDQIYSNLRPQYELSHYHFLKTICQKRQITSNLE